MKKNIVSRIQNVVEAEKMINFLLSRPRTEMVGLGLFYGAPGLGKTRYTYRTALQNGWIPMRLNATSTQKSFINELYDAIRYKLNIGERIQGGKNLIFDKVVEIMQTYEDIVIVVDEIDYAFKDKALLGMIRDLVDLTFCTIILVGMQHAKTELSKANSHYFDRCNGFYEFKSLSLADATLVINEISDITMDAPLIKEVFDLSSGTMRVLINVINTMEKTAKGKGQKTLTLAEIK